MCYKNEKNLECTDTFQIGEKNIYEKNVTVTNESKRGGMEP